MGSNGEGRRVRGRVVMLVDNGVRGDSRVQKTARSAADAGWDVTLLGLTDRRSADGETWRIGEAVVRLIWVKPVLLKHTHWSRRTPRRPLAYPDGVIAAYRWQRSRARLDDLCFRRLQLKQAREAGGGRWARLAGLTRLALPWGAAQVNNLWVRLRMGERRRLRRARQVATSPLNRLQMAYWSRLLGARSWRRLYPGLWDYMLAYGPIIDELRPDLIHAHDFRMIGVAARATLRLHAAGHDVKMIYDAHEFVPGIIARADNPRWLPAQIAYEKEHIKYADAVVTVSPTLAELLQETHALPERPAVVLNAPVRFPKGSESDGTVPDLRAMCGVDDATPLLVYCGGINAKRGVDLMVDALPRLPGVHVALVTLNPSGSNAASEALRLRAVALGVADRVHLLPYVPHWQVPPFVAAADAGVILMLHHPNHEIGLPSKFFEYSHARLPVVVSDVKTMAATVRATGQGEVYAAGDPDEYVAAVQKVLADPQRYKAAYDAPGLLDGWTWEAQAETLEGVYRRLLPGR